MERTQSKQFPDFISLSTRWLGSLFWPVWSAYDTLAAHLSTRNGFCERICRDYRLFYLLACLGMAPFVPKYFVMALHGLQRVVAPGNVQPVDGVVLPFVPPLLIGSVILFVLSYGAGRRTRYAILMAAGLFLLPTYFDTGAPALAGYLVIATGWLLLIKSSLPRNLIFLLLVASSVGVRALAYYSGSPALAPLGRLFQLQTILIPLLWYSTFAQYPPRHILSPLRFYIYQLTRLFGAPSATYDDYFRSSEKDLLRVRFAGIKALYSTLIGIHVIWWIEKHLQQPLPETSGLTLLFHSYLKYVAVYLHFLVEVNLFIGVLRLFGVPVRDNFNRAFLARTPNEHWQRWNILLREWVVTVSFFPMMRARRGLFLAVMAAMITSGLLHLPHTVMKPGGNWEKVGIVMAYWVINGLAIFAVLKIPRLYPQLVRRTGMAQGRTWAVAGVVLTSAFYAVLVGVRTTCETWPEVLDYFRRLVLT